LNISFLGGLFLLQLGNYASLEGVLYCRPHFEQLLKTTGSFEKSFDNKTGAEGLYTCSCQLQGLVMLQQSANEFSFY
jgi:hypothetical protein